MASLSTRLYQFCPFVQVTNASRRDSLKMDLCVANENSRSSRAGSKLAPADVRPLALRPPAPKSFCTLANANVPPIRTHLITGVLVPEQSTAIHTLRE